MRRSSFAAFGRVAVNIWGLETQEGLVPFLLAGNHLYFHIFSILSPEKLTKSSWIWHLWSPAKTKITPNAPRPKHPATLRSLSELLSQRMGWDAKGFVSKNHTTLSFWKSGYQQQSSGRFMGGARIFLGHSRFGKHDPSDGSKSYEIDLCHGARCISWTPAAQRSHHFCSLGMSSCCYPGWQGSLATEVRRKRKRPGLDFIEKKNGLTMFDCWDRDPESTYELPFLWTFSLGTLCKRCKRWVYDFWLYNS